MDFEEKLAQAIKLTQKFREESWDENEAQYTLTIIKAADKACDEVGFDKRMTQPVYLLNEYCWNDIQWWADKIYKVVD